MQSLKCNYVLGWPKQTHIKMVSVKVQAIWKLLEIQFNQTCFTDESSPWLTIPVFKICAKNLIRELKYG